MDYNWRSRCQQLSYLRHQRRCSVRTDCLGSRRLPRGTGWWEHLVHGQQFQESAKSLHSVHDCRYKSRFTLSNKWLFICSFNHSCIRLSIYLFIYLSVHSFSHSTLSGLQLNQDKSFQTINIKCQVLRFVLKRCSHYDTCVRHTPVRRTHVRRTCIIV